MFALGQCDAAMLSNGSFFKWNDKFYFIESHLPDCYLQVRQIDMQNGIIHEEERFNGYAVVQPLVLR